MNFLRGIVKWIASLESGSQFRKFASILLKLLGVLAFIGVIVWGIAICVNAITISDHLETRDRTVVIIGAILVLCINVIMGPILIMLFWNRSNKINALGEESHFTLMPIAVVLIRLFGEVGFLTLVGIGIQVLVFSIFSPNIAAMDILDSFRHGQLALENINGIEGIWLVISVISRIILITLLSGNFMMGIIWLVISVIGGVILLITYYLIAELINLFVDMATNLKKIETTLSTEENPSNS